MRPTKPYPPLRFRRLRRWPLPRRYSAICCPWGVCYHRVPLSTRLRLHEECHWRQYQRYGRLRFLARYLWESLRRGYWNNRFEVEAREAGQCKARPDDPTA